DQVEAMTLADRIVVLRAGRVEQVGTPLELYDDPDNTFVAGFIGSPRMNFIRARWTAEGSVTLPDFGDAVVPLDIAAKPQAGAELLLGIRPEHFDASGSVRFTVDVDLVEHLGGISLAYAGSATEHPLTIELRDRALPRPGQPLEVAFN